MGTSDKMQAGMDQMKGKVKEAVGDMTDNEKLEAEGKLDQAKGDLRSAAEKVKDSAKDAFGE